MIYTTDIKENLLALLKMDKIALLLTAMLLGTGILFIRCAGMDYGSTPGKLWIIQGVWIAIGFVFYLACALADYRILGKYSWMLFLGGLFLLMLVFVSGAKDFSHRSMLRLAGINIQVSEPMKAAALIFIAWVLSHPLLKFMAVPPFLLWLVLAMLPFGLVILHGDFGTALVFLPFSFAILIINGLKWRWLALAAVAIVLLTPPAFSSLGSFRKFRILVFMQPQCKNAIDTFKPMLSPEKHQELHAKLDTFIDDMAKQAENSHVGKVKLDTWNADQAIYSVGSGRIAGTGYMRGRQHTLGFLPRTVAPTDFIFAVIGEEAGFIGAVSVIAMFTLLIIMTLHTAFTASDAFGASIAVGAAFIYATHAFINIGMCIGLSPIIGIPLPFVSYGGSSVIGMMMIAGLVQSVKIHSEPSTKEASQENSENA